MNLSEYMTIREAAALLGVNRQTLRNWDNCDKFQLPVYRHPISKYRMYKKEDIEQFLSMIKAKEHRIK